MAKTSRRDPKIWIAKDGRKLPIKDLTDTHLSNIIKMLRRRTEELPPIYDVDGIELRGDEKAAELYINWGELVAEQNRRAPMRDGWYATTDKFYDVYTFLIVNKKVQGLQNWNKPIRDFEAVKNQLRPNPAEQKEYWCRNGVPGDLIGEGVFFYDIQEYGVQVFEAPVDLFKRQGKLHFLASITHDIDGNLLQPLQTKEPASLPVVAGLCFAAVGLLSVVAGNHAKVQKQQPQLQIK